MRPPLFFWAMGCGEFCDRPFLRDGAMDGVASYGTRGFFRDGEASSVTGLFLGWGVM